MITYLHLGQDVTVSLKDVIGIFDIEKTTVNKITREFLKNGEKSGSVINVSYELPKSFVVTQENDHTRIYISQISPATLLRRVGESAKPAGPGARVFTDPAVGTEG